MNDEQIKKEMGRDYPLVPMNDITPEARLLAVKWIETYGNMGMDIQNKHKLASDIMNYSRRNSKRPECNICKVDLICPYCFSKEKDDLQKVLTDRLVDLMAVYFPDVTNSYRIDVAQKSAKALFSSLKIEWQD